MRKETCKSFFILFFSTVVFFISCNTPTKSTEELTYTPEEIIKDAPILTAEQSLKVMDIEEGFKIELVAAEPMVTAPIAIAFDEKSRIWVVEMNGYMPDTSATNENAPIGKVVILEDEDGDGKADTRKVFLDSLVLPRALTFVENGLLVAAPPNLLFVEINNDKPGQITIVDTAYTAGGNVEHDSNGLLRGIDNWIYSAKSGKRYKKQNDVWMIEQTHMRGQWGITQDDFGRLYYNNNSQNLLGDYFLPGLGKTNNNLLSVAGFNNRIVTDNRVYPARPTTGVNRGYMENVLDSRMRLTNFTAACGPLYYRSNLFPSTHYGNVFVAEPAANLIKRNIIQENGYRTTGEQAYQDKEFLTSIDERFRPVNLHTGPDGAIYVVDMYRGIIQHKFFLTDYLKGEIDERNLTQPLNCGRIYRIVPDKAYQKAYSMPNNPDKLIGLLSSRNGWVRNKAQQMIVDNKIYKLEPALRANLSNALDTLAIVHSLWSLEGLGLLKDVDVLPLLDHPNWKVRMHALSAIAEINESNQQQFFNLLKSISLNDTLCSPVAVMQLTKINSAGLAKEELLHELIIQYRENPIIIDAILTNLEGKENLFYNHLPVVLKDTATRIYKRFEKVFSDIKIVENARNTALLVQQYPKGSTLFNDICASCHGKNGDGIDKLAPPLNNSHWVTGKKNRLIAIVLRGLTGPITVNNKVYQSPDIQGEMPGIGNNSDISDKDLAELLSFIRKNWTNKSDEIKTSDITEIRKQLGAREQPFTEKELLQW